MHPIDHPHAASIHQNGGKWPHKLREAGDVLCVLSVQTWGIAWEERRDQN
jgi:hypothetical protein